MKKGIAIMIGIDPQKPGMGGPPPFEPPASMKYDMEDGEVTTLPATFKCMDGMLELVAIDGNKFGRTSREEMDDEIESEREELGQKAEESERENMKKMIGGPSYG